MIFGSKKKSETPDIAAPADQAAPVTAQEQAANAVASAMSGGANSQQEEPQVGAQAGQTPDGAGPDELGPDGLSPEGLSPEMAAKITEVRVRLHETFGKVALAMMTVPRYRNLSLRDLGHLLLDPLMRDRVAIASPAEEGSNPKDGSLSGIAIWANVSEEVDAKIREQIKAGTFPIRLKSEDWTSGNINWLLDVIAPTQRLTTSVIANFRQVIKEGDLRIHPIVTRLVDPAALEKMGAQPIKTEDGQAGVPDGTSTH